MFEHQPKIFFKCTQKIWQKSELHLRHNVLQESSCRRTIFKPLPSPTPFRSPDHFLMSTEVNQVHKPTSPIIFDSLHMPEIASTSTPHALVSVIDFPRMMEHGHTCMGTGVAKYVSLSDINILSLIEPIQRQSESSVAPS